MKNLIKDKKANANMIILSIMVVIMGFGMLVLGTYIYYAIAGGANAGTITVSTGQQATGGLIMNADLVQGANGSLRITNGAAVYVLEFNSSEPSPTGCPLTPNCIVLNGNSTYYSNTSQNATLNLTAGINNNASLATFLTATANGNTTIITYNTVGTAGNSVVLTNFIGTASLVSGLGGIALSSPQNLAGGTNSVTGQASQNALNGYVEVVFPLFGLALMVLGFSVLLYTVRGSFGRIQGR